MAIKTYKLGELIELSDERNIDMKYGLEDVKGISTEKTFIETKANMDGVSLNSYKIVNNSDFVYVADTSRRGDKIALAFNKNKPILISSIYTVFKIKKENILNPDYLYMYFNRPEFDRYSRFNSWGSAREVFSWDDFCDTQLDLPDIETQKKYVNVYLLLVENQKAYERGLDDLKLVCDGYIERLRRRYNSKRIIDYLNERVETNKSGDLTFLNMKGVGLNGFILPNQERTQDSLKKCNIFYKGDFVYAPSSIKNGVISYNDKLEKAICTEEYIVFNIKNEEKLSPYYLLMWLKREQLGRYIDFNSCDSVRNRFYFKDLDIIEIPIPPIEIQESIANIYKVYNKRKEINERLKKQIKDICPILIKGSIDEAKKDV